MLQVTQSSLEWSHLTLAQQHRRQSKPGTKQHFTTTLSWAVPCTPTPQPRIKAKWLQHIPALLPALKRRVLLLSSAERDVSSRLLKQRWKTTCKRKGCCPHELKSLSSVPHFSKHPKLAPSSYHTADFRITYSSTGHALGIQCTLQLP